MVEGGDGGVGQAQVDLLGPVPGDGLVRADLVVFDAVLLGVLGEHDGVVDLVDEQPLVLQVPKPRSRDPFCPGVFTRVRTCANSG